MGIHDSAVTSARIPAASNPARGPHRRCHRRRVRDHDVAGQLGGPPERPAAGPARVDLHHPGAGRQRFSGNDDPHGDRRQGVAPDYVFSPGEVTSPVPLLALFNTLFWAALWALLLAWPGPIFALWLALCGSSGGWNRFTPPGSTERITPIKPGLVCSPSFSPRNHGRRSRAPSAIRSQPAFPPACAVP